MKLLTLALSALPLAASVDGAEAVARAVDQVTADEEFVVVSLLLGMMNNGAVVAGPLNEDGGVRFGYPGASATTPTPGEALTEADVGEGRRPRRAGSWVAYRAGRAPWEVAPDPAPDRIPVYELNEVSERPRLRGCPVLLELPPGETDTVRLIAELVVEVDSTASAIEIPGAPSAEHRRRALATIRSCRFLPGRLDGIPVRVRVRLPLTFTQ